MEEGVNIFSIKDLESYSGIKAHTIRIWEKRYGILEPGRTDSNIRTYNEAELRKILNVAYLNRNGYRISRIASLGDKKISEEVLAVSGREGIHHEYAHPDSLLTPSINFNEEKLIGSIAPYIRKLGIEAAYIKILHPMLLRSRILWQTGEISRVQEQFVRNTVSKVLMIEDNLTRQSAKPKAVVGMMNTVDHAPVNNFLFYKIALKHYGCNVIFTGGILPVSKAFEIHRIKPFSVLVVNHEPSDSSEKDFGYLSRLGRSLLLRSIIVTDYTLAEACVTPENIIITQGPEDFLRTISLLTRLKKAS